MKVARKTQEAWVAARPTWTGTFAEWHAHYKKERREREDAVIAAWARTPLAQDLRRRLVYFAMNGTMPR